MTRGLSILPSPIAVCRLAPDAAVPDWARGAFLSVTRTAGRARLARVEARRADPVRDDGRRSRAARTAGKGADQHLPISTYDTDYLLLKAESFAHALDVLRGAGYEV